MYRYHPVKNNRMFRHIRKYLFLLASLIFVQGNIFAGQRESQDTLSGFIQLTAKDYPITSNHLPVFTMQRNIDAASERADMSGMETNRLSIAAKTPSLAALSRSACSIQNASY